MEPEDLETILEIALGGKVARDVCRECADDPYRAVESLNRRAAALQAPYRASRPFDDHGFGKARKEIARLHLVARLIDELNYDLREDLDVELVRS
ncbi:MAG TPA: hypothetical protein VHG90_02055 [Acidimicrobiales bacterium]|nr:hypothetical protein [Acidimicrobiales bacterium]